MMSPAMQKWSPKLVFPAPITPRIRLPVALIVQKPDDLLRNSALLFAPALAPAIGRDHQDERLSDDERSVPRSEGGSGLRRIPSFSTKRAVLPEMLEK